MAELGVKTVAGLFVMQAHHLVLHKFHGRITERVKVKVSENSNLVISGEMTKRL